MPKPTPIKKPTTVEAPETVESVKAQLAQAVAANEGLARMLVNVSERCVNLGVEIKAALRPS